MSQAPTTGRGRRWRLVGHTLLDHLAFNSPRARALNLVGILGLAAAVPTERLDWLPVRSIWERVFGIQTPSVGLTRAMSRLMHGDLSGAWGFNPLVFPVFGIVIFLIAVALRGWLLERRARKGIRSTPDSAKNLVVAER